MERIDMMEHLEQYDDLVDEALTAALDIIERYAHGYKPGEAEWQRLYVAMGRCHASRLGDRS